MDGLYKNVAIDTYRHFKPIANILPGFCTFRQVHVTSSATFLALRKRREALWAKVGPSKYTGG